MNTRAVERAWRTVVLAASFTLFLRPAVVGAQATDTATDVRVLEDGWLYRAGDDPSWATRDLEDSGWSIVGVNVPWLIHEAPPDQIGWYRKHVRVSPDRPLQVGLQRVYDAAELYVDGRLVATSGRPGAADPGPVVPFHGHVPASDTSDGEIVVAVRVWGGLNHRQDGRLSGLLLGPPSEVTYALLAQKHAAWTSPEGLPQIFLGLLLTGLGLVHGLIFLRRRLPEEGLFALAMLLLGPLTGWQAAQRIGIVDATWLYSHLSIMIRASAYAALIGFASAFMGGRHRRLAALTALVLVSAGLASIVHLGSPWWRVIPAAYGLGAIVGVVMLVESLRWHHPGARLMLLGFLPLVVWGLSDSLSSIVGLPPSYSLVRPWLGQAATGAVALSISAVLALRFADNLDRLDRTYQASQRFVPAAFLRLLGRDTITDVQRGDSTMLDCTVMFCDIRDFTTLCERRSPDAVYALINGFLARMEPCVHDHGGTIGQYLGDGFLALFPLGQSDPVGAAVAMQLALEGVGDDLVLADEMPLRMGVGLHAGEVILGILGGAERLDANLVSDAVNTAARVQGLCTRYGSPVLVTELVLAGREATRWEFLEIDTVIVKGRSQPLRIFEVLDGEPDANLRELKVRDRTAYTEALAAYRNGDLDHAARLFSRLRTHPAARELFLMRCQEASGRELPSGWSGVARWDEK